MLHRAHRGSDVTDTFPTVGSEGALVGGNNIVEDVECMPDGCTVVYDNGAYDGRIGAVLTLILAFNHLPRS